jgi:anti-anti-sigma factor
MVVSTERQVTRLTRQANKVWLLEFFGAADQKTFQQIWASETDRILNLLEKVNVQKLIIDLTTIQNFASQDLQLLVTLHKHLARQNIQITLRNPGQHLSRVLRIMQFDHVFEIESDPNDE